MKRYFREIFGEDIQRAIREVNEWGYEAPEYLADNFVWISCGPGVYFWIGLQDYPDAQLHACIAPTMRGRALKRDWLVGCAAIAEFLGASRFAVNVTPKVGEYLMRSGPWVQHPNDWYTLNLGREVVQ